MFFYFVNKICLLLHVIKLNYLCSLCMHWSGAFRGTNDCSSNHILITILCKLRGLLKFWTWLRSSSFITRMNHENCDNKQVVSTFWPIYTQKVHVRSQFLISNRELCNFTGNKLNYLVSSFYLILFVLRY